MADHSVRFHVLGPLALSRGDETVVLSQSNPTVLLAALLLRPNELVTNRQLQRVLWERDEPKNVQSTIHTCVKRLRRSLAGYGVADDAITSVVGGYRLRVAADTLDLVEFRRLVREAGQAARPSAEAALLTKALALWNGEPAANITSGTLHQTMVPPVEEERLHVAERLFDIELREGRCRAILPALTAAACGRRSHERFSEQLMEALYRVGRRADALVEYRNLRAHLREDFGVDPRPSAQRLELAILRGEHLGMEFP